MCDLVAHFFFSKLETDLAKTIKEKLESLTKPKVVQQAGQNKKHVLEISMPLKLKKSMQRVSLYCLEQMKANENDDDAWFPLPEAKALFDRYPKVLTWKWKAASLDSSTELDQQSSHLKIREEMSMREKVLKAAGIESCSLPDENLELIFYRVVNGRETREHIFPEYMAMGGYQIESSRIAAFLKLMLGTEQKMDRQDCNRLRSILDSKLNINGVMIVLTLAMYYYDQENSGKFLAEGINLAGETAAKLSILSVELSQFENTGRMAICSSGLMESPIWFFNNLIYLIKVCHTYADPHRAVRLVPEPECEQTLLEGRSVAHEGVRRANSLLPFGFQGDISDPRNDAAVLPFIQERSQDLFSLDI